MQQQQKRRSRKKKLWWFSRAIGRSRRRTCIMWAGASKRVQVEPRSCEISPFASPCTTPPPPSRRVLVGAGRISSVELIIKNNIISLPYLNQDPLFSLFCVVFVCRIARITMIALLWIGLTGEDYEPKLHLRFAVWCDHRLRALYWCCVSFSGSRCVHLTNPFT